MASEFEKTQSELLDPVIKAQDLLGVMGDVCQTVDNIALTTDFATWSPNAQKEWAGLAGDLAELYYSLGGLVLQMKMERGNQIQDA